MDLKSQDTGLMILHFKKVETPVCLTTADIMCIQVKLDLILGSPKLHGGTIMAFVDILVNVFDCFDRGNRLHIDMTPVLPDEILVVTDDPSVVNLEPLVWTCANGVASVMMSCPGIRVFSDSGTLIERLGKCFCACSMIHTGRVGILITTGAMDHELFDKLKQLRIVLRKLR